MGYLKRYTQAPTEVLDREIDFTNWLAARQDSIASFTTDCDSGVVIESSTQIGGVIQVVVAGGEAGMSYRVIAEITTTGPPVRVRRGEIQIRIRGEGELAGVTIDGGTLDDLGAGEIIDGGTV